MVIPVAISLFLAFQVRTIREHTHDVGAGTQIVCFDEQMCAIKVRGKWYEIKGTINMEETIPDEYQFDTITEPNDEELGTLLERQKQ